MSDVSVAVSSLVASVGGLPTATASESCAAETVSTSSALSLGVTVLVSDAPALAGPELEDAKDAGATNKDPDDVEMLKTPLLLLDCSVFALPSAGARDASPEAVTGGAVGCVFIKELKLGALPEAPKTEVLPPKTEELPPKTEELAPKIDVVVGALLFSDVMREAKLEADPKILFPAPDDSVVPVEMLVAFNKLDLQPAVIVLGVKLNSPPLLVVVVVVTVAPAVVDFTPNPNPGVLVAAAPANGTFIPVGGDARVEETGGAAGLSNVKPFVLWELAEPNVYLASLGTLNKFLLTPVPTGLLTPAVVAAG